MSGDCSDVNDVPDYFSMGEPERGGIVYLGAENGASTWDEAYRVWQKADEMARKRACKSAARMVLIIRDEFRKAEAKAVILNPKD